MRAPPERDRDATEAALGSWLARVTGDPQALVSGLDVPLQGSSGDTLMADARWHDQSGSHEERLVWRLDPPEPLLFMNPDVVVEGRVMRAVGRHGVPVPAVRWLEPDPAILGTPFVVMEFVDGRVPSTVPSYHRAGWTTGLTADEVARMHDTGLRALAGIHAVPWELELGFLRDGAPQGRALDAYLAQLERFHAFAARGRNLGLIDAALEHVLRERPRNDKACLVWGSPTPVNIIFGDDLSVRAVIDWEKATLGPPEIDVGWWLMFEEWQTKLLGVEPLPGTPTREATVAAYERMSGRTLRDLDYYILVGYLVFSIVTTRFVGLQVERGNLPPDATMHLYNPLTQQIARLLDLPVPDLAPEYAAIAAASER